MANLVYKGNKANLPATRNATSFYLCEDTRELFFGANLYTEAVRFFTTTKPANPAQGVLYIDEADGTGYAWNGSAWKTVIESAQGIKDELIGTAQDTKDDDTIYGAKAYADDAVDTAKDELIGANTDTYNDDTIKGAKKYADKKAEDVIGTASDTKDNDTVKGAKALANEKVASIAEGDGISVDNTNPTAPEISVKLQATDNDLAFNANGELFYKAAAAAEYSIAQQATAETGYAATYYLTKDGTQVGAKINIPKDFLVKGASVETVTVDDQPYEGAEVGDKYIDFVINAKDASATAEHLYLPVNDLVDVYTSGSSVGDMVVIAIDGNNRITATITDGTVTLAKLASAVQTEINKAHTHSNKALLDTYTQTEADLADAVSKKHEHANKTELDLFQTGDRQKLVDAYEAITVGSF